MTRHDDHVDDLLDRLCDCENYHVCEWHQRLRKGVDRSTVERDMWDELDERHWQYAIEKGYL